MSHHNAFSYSDPGYTLAIDNVQKLMTVKHQATNAQNKMQLWAMALLVEHRIPFLGENHRATQNASELDLNKFFLNEEDWSTLTDYVKTMIKKILVTHMDYFKV